MESADIAWAGIKVDAKCNFNIMKAKTGILMCALG